MCESSGMSREAQIHLAISFVMVRPSLLCRMQRVVCLRRALMHILFLGFQVAMQSSELEN